MNHPTNPKEKYPARGRALFDFGTPKRNRPGLQDIHIRPLDYFQLRFNFLCEAAQSLK